LSSIQVSSLPAKPHHFSQVLINNLATGGIATQGMGLPDQHGALEPVVIKERNSTRRCTSFRIGARPPSPGHPIEPI